jgi:pyruvate-ferredoxin/flavodoxin oxidoreductase
MENRFKMLTLSKPEVAKELLALAQDDVMTRWHFYEYLASRQSATGNGGDSKE